MTGDELRQQWAFGGLIDVPSDYLASVPVPIPREAGLAGKVTITYVDVATPPTIEEMVAVLGARWDKFRDGFRMPVVKTVPQHPSFGIVQYVAWKRAGQRTPEQLDAAFASADPVSTASTTPDRRRR